MPAPPLAAPPSPPLPAPPPPCTPTFSDPRVFFNSQDVTINKVVNISKKMLKLLVECVFVERREVH